jgi:riboflavin kinase/FMN adenylyltransferase
MEVVSGVEGLRPDLGPIFAVIGVFDGLHRGHIYLLEHLVREAEGRGAHPTVITFDHHPDEVLTGTAPPLLLHPDERLERLAGADVDVTVIQPFDEVVRHTTYEDFLESIRRRTVLAGLLMTPDAAFGFERRGTPDAVAALGATDGFDVVVVPPFELDGAPVRSSEVRTAIATGDLERAARLLGRPVTVRAELDDGRLGFDWPMAMPPDGGYAIRVGGSAGQLTIEGGDVRLRCPGVTDGPVELTIVEAGSGDS